MVKHINNSFLVVVISALLIGLSKFDPPSRISVFTLLFALFYLALRLKTYLDDFAFFKAARLDTPNFKVGFVLAIISWCVWALSGYMIYKSDSLISLFLLGISISVSTIWIIAEGLRQGASKEQYSWIIMNALYVTLLWSIHGFRELLPEWTKLLLMICLLILLCLDFHLSKSFKKLELPD